MRPKPSIVQWLRQLLDCRGSAEIYLGLGRIALTRLAFSEGNSERTEQLALEATLRFRRALQDMAKAGTAAGDS